MYYAPIDSLSYEQLYPEVKSIPKNTDVKTSLKDYLRAYGYSIESSLGYYEGKPSPQSLLAKVLKAGHPGKVDEISQASDQQYKGADKPYLTGEWFELYCYHFFKQAFQLKDNQIACSVEIKRNDNHSPHGHDNEFDLMFVHQNDLYVFECKVYPAEASKLDRISKTMFKLASLSQSKNFGLKCKKYLAVLGHAPVDRKSIQQTEDLRQTLGITKILDIEAFGKYSGKDILREDKEFKINQLLEKFKAN